MLHVLNVRSLEIDMTISEKPLLSLEFIARDVEIQQPRGCRNGAYVIRRRLNKDETISKRVKKSFEMEEKGNDREKGSILQYYSFWIDYANQ
jgi:hypothetical protein